MQSLVNEKDVISTFYDMFMYSISNELARKYYERRLRKFFDYIGFNMQSNLGERCNSFEPGPGSSPCFLSDKSGGISESE